MIRKMMESDTQDLYEVISDPDVMKYIEPPFSMEQTKQFLKGFGLCDPPRSMQQKMMMVSLSGMLFFMNMIPTVWRSVGFLRRSIGEKDMLPSLRKIFWHGQRTLEKML